MGQIVHEVEQFESLVMLDQGDGEHVAEDGDHDTLGPGEVGQHEAEQETDVQGQLGQSLIPGRVLCASQDWELAYTNKALTWDMLNTELTALSAMS